ncbi:MAG TPA: secretin N-terminal domain-containing protein [Pyrinomonadaceae bacterium]|nr:secretin N-terminal domain-containing protein [Pyrinomonadaceae bacterium]
MFSIKQIKLAVIVLCLALTATTALAQQPTPQPQPSPESPSFRAGLRNRVFELKHRDPESLLSVIRLLGSGMGGASMSVNNDFNTITVRDFPENIATIEEAIRRLDTPVPPAPGIEFHVHILIATNAPTAATPNPLPSELNDVVRQLQATLKYKNYSLMTSDVLRTKEGATGTTNKGVADFKLVTESAARNSPIFYEYVARPVRIEGTTPSTSTVQIGAFSFSMRIPVEVSTGQIQYDRVGFDTPVSMREGEKVVVGTTTMQDKGLIVVITARITR